MFFLNLFNNCLGCLVQEVVIIQFFYDRVEVLPQFADFFFKTSGLLGKINDSLKGKEKSRLVDNGVGSTFGTLH